VPFSTTTTRAIAASAAIIAASGTVAGAAVFHVPILGFGRAEIAAATVEPPTNRTPARAPMHSSSRVIVKTRYVDDIVHRRGRIYAAPTLPTSAPVVAPAGAPSATSPTSTAATTSTTATTTSTSVPRREDDGHDGNEHDGSVETGHDADTTSTQASAVDR
jgi:hypothetical protein